jgi:ATP-binding protein involved in chromosome partitioning
MGTESRRDGLVGRARAALAAAEVGADVTDAGVADLGALEVGTGDGVVTVDVTLPLPPGELRATVEREIRGALAGLDGVSSVECRFDPRVPDPGVSVDLAPEVRNVVAVASGKGGVGKSTVAVNLAVALAAAGASVGLLDADVYGPNAPAMLGLEDRTPEATHDDGMVPREAHGVKVMSMGFIAGEDDPVIWRGPLVDDFLKQLFGDVAWGSLDYLIVDLPPGTGDAHLSLVQHLPLAGAVIVTTPQPVATDDARRGLQGFVRYDVPILGIVENMAGFECPDCGTGHDVFDAGGADRLSEEFEVPVLGRLPLDPAVGTLDGGDEAPTPPGISVPGIGRLQLPRTRAERERPTTLAPVGIREEAGDVRTAAERMVVRTASRVNALASGRVDRVHGRDGTEGA